MSYYITLHKTIGIKIFNIKNSSILIDTNISFHSNTYVTPISIIYKKKLKLHCWEIPPLLHHPQIIPPILPNKEKYIRPIHSLQHSFSLTLPRLPPTIYFYLKIHPTRDFILSFSSLRDKQHRNRSVQRDRGEAETV